MTNHTFYTSRVSHCSIIIFCLLCFLGCTSEYIEHYDEENTPVISRDFIHIDTIGESTGSRILVFPDILATRDFLERLRHAKKRIWIEVYTLTDHDVVKAIVDAKKSGVDVRIILEGNVYGTPFINNVTFKKLRDANISVVYADNYRFTFTHAKFFLIDDLLVISTGNLAHTSFISNRDIMLLSREVSVLHFLENLFLADFSHKKYISDTTPDTIVTSPENSRDRIESLIKAAHTSIDLYIQTLEDNDLLDLLKLAQRQGKTVHICTADTRGVHTVEQTQSGFSWVQIQKPYLHAKILIIDRKIVFLGSQNFTKNALENNREVGIVIKQNDITNTLLRFFQKDCIFP